jgi:Ca2+-binding EF-hand superfamily protein
LFRSIALNNQDKMIDSDFERFLFELNRRYGREYNKEDAIEFFNALDVSNTGVLDLNEFKRAFSRIIMSLD